LCLGVTSNTNLRNFIGVNSGYEVLTAVTVKGTGSEVLTAVTVKSTGSEVLTAVTMFPEVTL
jgi:hypothetical protein